MLLSNWLQLLYWCAAEQSLGLGRATRLSCAALLPFHTYFSQLHPSPHHSLTVLPCPACRRLLVIPYQGKTWVPPDGLFYAATVLAGFTGAAGMWRVGTGVAARRSG